MQSPLPLYLPACPSLGLWHQLFAVRLNLWGVVELSPCPRVLELIQTLVLHQTGMFPPQNLIAQKPCVYLEPKISTWD